jgi:hypothetical protein
VTGLLFAFPRYQKFFGPAAARGQPDVARRVIELVGALLIASGSGTVYAPYRPAAPWPSRTRSSTGSSRWARLLPAVNKGELAVVYMLPVLSTSPAGRRPPQPGRPRSGAGAWTRKRRRGMSIRARPGSSPSMRGAAGSASERAGKGADQARARDREGQSAHEPRAEKLTHPTR